MNLNILFLISTLLLSTLARYYDQDRMYKIDNFNEYLNNNFTNNNEKQMKTYYEAIKETFELYHRDARYKKGKVCRSSLNSQDIANRENFYENLKQNFDNNCTYIIGNVVIAHISNEDISFLNTIEEISGYLFIFSNAIETISMKNLKIIRGENAFVKKEKFSLLVANNYIQNEMLKFLEMPNLQVVLRNNVLFISNPGLCYAVRKINWDSLLGKNQKIIINEANKTVCAINNDTIENLNCHSTCPKFSDKQYCWTNSSLGCQKINDCVVRSCSESVKCYENTILKTEECCHDECAGGCFGPSRTQCLACKNFNNDGACVENCPRQYRHDGIKYIKNSHGKLAFNYICVDKCPLKFLNEHENCVTQCTIENSYAVNQTCLPCPKGKCPKLCHSKDIIKNEEIEYVYRETLNRLENCTAYDGNIIINNLSFIGDDFHNLTSEHHGIRQQDLKKTGKIRRNLRFIIYICWERGAMATIAKIP